MYFEFCNKIRRNFLKEMLSVDAYYHEFDFYLNLLISEHTQKQQLCQVYKSAHMVTVVNLL